MKGLPQEFTHAAVIPLTEYLHHFSGLKKRMETTILETCITMLLSTPTPAV